MKTLAIITSAALIGLLTVNTAQARDDDYDNHGQALCQFGDRVLAPTGFVQGGVYTTDGIRQVLAGMNVNSGNLRPLIPGCRYRVTYTCKVYHQLATGTLTALPVAPMHRGEPGALVQWKFSKYMPL